MKRFKIYIEQYNLNEDAKADFVAREMAAILQRRLSNIFKSSAQRQKYIYRNSGEMNFLSVQLEEVSGASKVFDNLILVLRGEKDAKSTVKNSITQGEFAFSSGQELIYIYCLPDNFEYTNPKKYSNVGKYFDKFKTIFIHEITHLMDRRRWKTPKEYFKSNVGNSTKNQTQSEYINTPGEYNAWFQGLTSFLDNTILKLLTFDQRANLLLTRKKDYKWFIALYRSYSSIDDFDKKYKQKYLKRLVATWDLYMQKIEDEVESYKNGKI